MSAPGNFNFTTGPSHLPDIGKLEYNGCHFSPLFVTTVSGRVVRDEANRTAKYMQYEITADGYVTAPTGFPEGAAQVEVRDAITDMRRLLSQQGGALVYQGRGCDLVVNAAGGGGVRDVAWGPAPELLEFQPMGGRLSAKCVWKVTVKIPEITAQIQRNLVAGGVGGAALLAGGNRGGIAAIPLLQFVYESGVSYGEDGYSSLSVNGILEITLTRSPNQTTRTLTQTADDMRALIESRVMAGIDGSRFRMTKRDFNLSKDKRTLTWSIQADEKSWHDLPPGCTTARGTYSVKPAKQGMGLCNWLCHLTATYTVAGPHRQGDAGAGPRRIAWLAFLALLRLKMAYSVLSPNIVPGGNQNPGRAANNVAIPPIAGDANGRNTLNVMQRIINVQQRVVGLARKAWLIDFHFSEGLYLDSKTTSFSATWRLVCPFNHILLASGLWRRVPETDAQGRNLWATSVQNIMGAQSWLPNKADPSIDVIVDFGGP